LPGYEPLGTFGPDVYAVYLPTRFLSPKVRAFVDFFVQRFGPQPYLDIGFDTDRSCAHPDGGDEFVNLQAPAGLRTCPVGELKGLLKRPARPGLTAPASGR